MEGEKPSYSSVVPTCAKEVKLHGGRPVGQWKSLSFANRRSV